MRALFLLALVSCGKRPAPPANDADVPPAVAAPKIVSPRPVPDAGGWPEIEASFVVFRLPPGAVVLPPSGRVEPGLARVQVIKVQMPSGARVEWHLGQTLIAEAPDRYRKDDKPPTVIVDEADAYVVADRRDSMINDDAHCEITACNHVVNRCTRSGGRERLYDEAGIHSKQVMLTDDECLAALAMTRSMRWAPDASQ